MTKYAWIRWQAMRVVMVALALDLLFEGAHVVSWILVGVLAGIVALDERDWLRARAARRRGAARGRSSE